MTRPVVGTGVWSGVLRSADAHETAAAAAELESIGYSALWIRKPGTGIAPEERCWARKMQSHCHNRARATGDGGAR